MNKKIPLNFQFMCESHKRVLIAYCMNNIHTCTHNMTPKFKLLLFLRKYE